MSHIRDDEERELFRRLYRVAYRLAPMLKGRGLLRGDPSEMKTPDEAGDPELDLLAAGYLATGEREGRPREASMNDLRIFLTAHDG